ncbi:TIGR00730 family Rossman fold protein [Anaerofustis sp.]|uniref:LOG family protein n=1 Tax=Anaerofustis sp. TaxID=1872517 RepID=UPI0025BF6610|nr:TIGR00730 family Rossman fold protein [Anaerofustis sp.]
MNICIYGSYSKNLDEKMIQVSKNIGEALAKRGHNLIFGGGKNGLLGELAKAVNNNNRETMGIILDDSDMENFVYKECSTLISKKNMSERKLYMEDNSDGFIILPGGIGTLDEFFEILVLKNKGIWDKPIVLFNHKDFFNDLILFMKKIIKENMMNENIFDLFYITDSMSDMFNYLENY